MRFPIFTIIAIIAVVNFTTAFGASSENQTTRPATRPSSASESTIQLRQEIADLKQENQRLGRIAFMDQQVFQKQIRALESANWRLERQIEIMQGKTPTDTLGLPHNNLYDATKSPHPGDAGMPLNGSNLRPDNPLKAYEGVKVGMSLNDVLGILGGWQSEAESDNIKTIEWLFEKADGGDIMINVDFKDGVVFSKSKNDRG